MSRALNAIEDLIAEAERYLAERETPRGSNRSVRIDYWNLETIQDFREYPMGGCGAPWCASFISQVGIQALGRRSWPVRITSVAHELYLWGEERELVSVLPHRGDIFATDPDGDERYNHVGIVTDVADQRFETVEGNTNEGGAREGYGVLARSRRLTDRMAFIRWAEMLASASEH
jgi:hypothetical protein